MLFAETDWGYTLQVVVACVCVAFCFWVMFKEPSREQ